MACNNVGSTNSDIAGLGVILSFTIQAGLSFCLSAWSVLLQYQKWVADLPDQPANQNTLLARAQARAQGRFNYLEVLFIYLEALLNCLKAVFSYPINSPAELLFALTSSFSSKLQPDQIRDLTLKSDLIDRVLKTINDVQTFNGIALLIGAITQYKTLSLYHYHIVFDTVNFTGISMAAALVIVLKKPNAIAFRVALLFVFLVLYVAFVILFGLKLQLWDDSITGYCYNTGGISTQSAAHPYVDNIYLAITAFYMVASLLVSLQAANGGLQKSIRYLHSPLVSGNRSLSSIGWLNFLEPWLYCTSLDVFLESGFRSLMKNAKLSPELWHSLLDPLSQDYRTSTSILAIGLVQYPLHVYTLFALRSSNEVYLSGDSENQWGFGQVVALVLVASVLLECFRAIIDYVGLKWKRRHARANEFKKSLLPLFWTLLLDQEEEQESPLLRRRRSLPAVMKYQ